MVFLFLGSGPLLHKKGMSIFNLSKLSVESISIRKNCDGTKHVAKKPKH